MTTKQPNLTAERCDECIWALADGRMGWHDSSEVIGLDVFATPDEAELFAYRLLAAVKRARGE